MKNYVRNFVVMSMMIGAFAISTSPAFAASSSSPRRQVTSVPQPVHLASLPEIGKHFFGTVASVDSSSITVTTSGYGKNVTPTNTVVTVNDQTKYHGSVATTKIAGVKVGDRIIIITTQPVTNPLVAADVMVIDSSAFTPQSRITASSRNLSSLNGLKTLFKKK